MTEDEVTKVLGDLHMLHLANEPKNIDDLIYSWLAFFQEDDARVIAKACYIYTKIRKNHFWPAPGDIEALKKRAEWLIEIENREMLKSIALGGENPNTKSINSSNPSLTPPSAPAINIADQAQSFCDICGLCDERIQSECPMDC